MSLLASQLDEIAHELVSVENDIKEISEQMKTPCDAETLAYLRSKEAALRSKEAALRSEKAALRSEKVEIMKSFKGSRRFPC